jgi:hypothetical protein
MSAETLSSQKHSALSSLAASDAGNIPEVDFASITVHEAAGHTLYTAASTDPLAEQADTRQYELREGPVTP